MQSSSDHQRSHHTWNVSLHYLMKYCCELLNTNIIAKRLRCRGTFNDHFYCKCSAECFSFSKEIVKIGQYLMKSWNSAPYFLCTTRYKHLNRFPLKSSPANRRTDERSGIISLSEAITPHDVFLIIFGIPHNLVKYFLCLFLSSLPCLWWIKIITLSHNARQRGYG